jgi:hypothetical protein
MCKNHGNTNFLSFSTPTHMYTSIIHTKCFNALAGIQAIIICSTVQQSRKAAVYHSGRDNQGCCVQVHKEHNCNTNEGCTYQGHNNQGLHFTEIAINSWDVIFKDRFMLAPRSWISHPGKAGLNWRENSTNVHLQSEHFYRCKSFNTITGKALSKKYVYFQGKILKGHTVE